MLIVITKITAKLGKSCHNFPTKYFCKNPHFQKLENVISCVQQLSIESPVFTKGFFRFFEAFCLFDALVSCSLKKYQSFAIVYQSLVSTYAVFAELKQSNANCVVTDTHTLTD